MITLTAVLAFYIVVSGIFELVVFARLRRLRGAIWFLVDGVVSLVLAGLIFFQWPWSSLWFIGTLVGISLLLSGVARITLPLSLRPALSCDRTKGVSHENRASAETLLSSRSF